MPQPPREPDPADTTPVENRPNTDNVAPLHLADTAAEADEPHPAADPLRRAGAPVPITVWPASPADATGESAVAGAIARAVATYSRPGDRLVDLDPTVQRVAITVAQWRQVTAVVTQPGNADALHAAIDADLPVGRRAAVRVVQTSHDRLTGLLSATPGWADVILADSIDYLFGHHRSPASWVTAVSTALRPGGHLIMICRDGIHPDRPVSVIAESRRAGLIYTQHIVALTVALHGDGFAIGAQVRLARTLHRIHADLYVLSKMPAHGDPDVAHRETSETAHADISTGSPRTSTRARRRSNRTGPHHA